MPNYGILDTAEKVELLIDRLLAEDDPIVIDIESGYTGPDQEGIAVLPFHPNWIIAGISLTNSEDWARYFPINHDGIQNVEPVQAARAVWKLVRSGRTIAHNASFELNGIARWLRDVLWHDEIYAAAIRDTLGYFPVFSDTMFEAFYMGEYDPLRVGVGLKGLTKHIFGYEQAEIQSLFTDLPKNKMKFLRFNTRDPYDPKVTEYVCDDVTRALALHRKHYHELEKNFAFKTDIALLPIVGEMEYHGVLLDWSQYDGAIERTKNFQEQWNEQIQQYLSERLERPVAVNLASPQQVAKVLYDKEEGLGLPEQKDRKTGQTSTSVKALEGIKNRDPVIKKILQYREIGALLSRYLVKYVNQLHYDPKGYAHPNHKQIGTITGRFSVDGFSYQQLPKSYDYQLDNGERFHLGYKDFVISPEDYRIVGYDYANVELRFIAGLAGETDMIQAFVDGEDIHKSTASAALNVPIDEVTGEDRQKGKGINFAIVFQSGVAALAQTLGMTVPEAQDLLDAYFARFPKLRAWMDSVVAEAHSTGKVENYFGYKARIWEFMSTAKNVVAKGERLSVNAPV